MKDLCFVEWDELLATHRSQLEPHGGQDGFIDEGVVRSAMARAQFTAQYDPDADLADLAAEYFYGLATTQGFCDGNKRVALVSESGRDIQSRNATDQVELTVVAHRIERCLERSAVSHVN